MLQLNRNIKLIRELSGFTQVEIAHKMNTSLSNVKTYETSDIRPKANILAFFADLAGITVEDLENKKLTHKDVNIRSKKGKKVSRETDLDQIVDELKTWQAGVEATLSVLQAEIIPLIVAQNPEQRSSASVFERLNRDIEEGTRNRIASLKREK